LIYWKLILSKKPVVEQKFEVEAKSSHKGLSKLDKLLFILKNMSSFRNHGPLNVFFKRRLGALA